MSQEQAEGGRADKTNKFQSSIYGCLSSMLAGERAHIDEQHRIYCLKSKLFKEAEPGLEKSCEPRYTVPNE